MSNRNWNNDKVQFARLLCELAANCDNLELGKVAASMDLEAGEIVELFDRASAVWEDAKAKVPKNKSRR